MDDIVGERLGRARSQFPVVGIGAFAGGLDALREFLAAMPADSGASYVVIQHLDPAHKSILTELLGRSTKVPVVLAEDGLVPEADTVYVIAENATLTLRDGRLHVEEPAPPRPVRTPIDTFFQSLAIERGEGAVAIVLSGTGSDGTQGARLLKEAGGYVIVQDPATAGHDAMPRNAIATGLVDKVLAPHDMPAAIADYLAHLAKTDLVGRTDEEEARRHLARICQQLKLATGHEFRQYKEPTLYRRVARRMQVRSIETIAQYADLLRQDKDEALQLFRELLISVTDFFRDPDAFAALETTVDAMLRQKKGGDALRVWVAGCATGEEAYSLAMLLADKTQSLKKPLRISIFATDIDESALAAARRATYPDSIAAQVPERYLSRYFRKIGNEYQVGEEIRELCIFSVQSLIKDPPFSRLDLLSCRNVLIYLKPELQERLIPIFHYALRPGAFLLLGPSESISGHEPLFEPVDKKWRLFRRKPDTQSGQPRVPLIGAMGEPAGTWGPRPPKPLPSERDDVIASARAVLVGELSPAYAVVGTDRELVYSGGPIADYLRMHSGTASLEFFNLVREELRMDLRSLWHRVTTDGLMVVRERVKYQDDGLTRHVRLIGQPLGNDRSGAPHYLIAFHDLGVPPAAEGEAGGAAGPGSAEFEALEAQLRLTREYLQNTTEELESSNEELQSANEELMSMNEELQSSNEELETAKEELQSTNEELETVNAELSVKLDELGRSNSDLANLLASTDIATLFLDADARVRRFTPVARRIFNLIETDVGRPIKDISSRVGGVDLAGDVARIMDTLTPIEREVSLNDGTSTFLMRLMPYRSQGNVIEGAVVTFVDISPLATARADSERKAAQQAYIARVGGLSLGGAKTKDWIQELPRELSALIGTDCAKVLFLTSDNKSVQLVVAHGFSAPPGTLVDGGNNSQAGYTLKMQEPVVVEDLRTEPRFNGPPLLVDEGIISGMSVIVGTPKDPIGVIGVHAREPRKFRQDDVAFLQSVANILAAAMRREASDRQKRLLLDELRHRVKNMLAMVQAVVSLSLRDSGLSGARIERVTQRLRALAMAHDLNFRREDDNVDLNELVLIQVRPYDPEGARISIHGNSTVALQPSLAIDASMVVHELATNAVKHGALSREGGTVRIEITTEGRAGQQMVRLRWEEDNGVDIEPAEQREGAGSRLLAAIATRRWFDIERSYAPRGLRCEMTIAAGGR